MGFSADSSNILYINGFAEKRILFTFLGVVSFLLGSFFLFFGLHYDTSLFFRKLFGKIGLQLLLAFAVVFFFLHLEKQDLLTLFQQFAAGAPDVLYSFVSTFLLVFIRALFSVFFYPLLILSTVFLALWIGFWIYPWIQTKSGINIRLQCSNKETGSKFLHYLQNRIKLKEAKK